VTLTKLSDADFRVEDPCQILLPGCDVYDVDGDKVGTVEEVYVDDEERKVHTLSIESGSLLGTPIGQTHRMVSVERVRDVSEDRVSVVMLEA
jgi:sporulation protein YlmC with PRC-barrel domain